MRETYGIDRGLQERSRLERNPNLQDRQIALSHVLQDGCCALGAKLAEDWKGTGNESSSKPNQTVPEEVVWEA